MRILTLCTVLSFLRIFAAGFSTRRVDFQHPAVQELLRNFSSDGSVYAGAPWPAVQLPVEAPIFAAAEVVKQEQGLRCAIVADMNKAEIGIRDEAGSFQLPSVVQPGSRESRCCRVPALAAAANKAPDPDAFGLHCMPSFVVAGAQKSGTTFLAAALAQHPQISFSLRKELHYFNNEAHYSKGLREGYLRSFPAWNYTDPLWKYGPPMYVPRQEMLCAAHVADCCHLRFLAASSPFLYPLLPLIAMAKLHLHISRIARRAPASPWPWGRVRVWCCCCGSLSPACTASIR